MSFAITAAVVGIGAMAYSADAQRKAINQQQDALSKAQADDARQKVEAETGAALGANQKLAADKRARQANVLALGGNNDSTLGQPGATGAAGAMPGNVLAQGASPAQRAVAAAPTSVLGSGAPGGSPRLYSGSPSARGGMQP